MDDVAWKLALTLLGLGVGYLAGEQLVLGLQEWMRMTDPRNERDEHDDDGIHLYFMCATCHVGTVYFGVRADLKTMRAWCPKCDKLIGDFTLARALPIETTKCMCERCRAERGEIDNGVQH